jgi:hypothetical protein
MALTAYVRRDVQLCRPTEQHYDRYSEYEKSHRWTLYNRGDGDIGARYRFAGKIDLAFALSVIDEEFCDALRVINKVRNAFGHATTMQSFGDPEIADLVVLIPNLDSNIPDIKFRLLAKMKEIETHLQGVVAAANASPPK